MATHKNNKPEQSPNLPSEGSCRSSRQSMPLFEFTQQKSIPDEHLMTALESLGYVVFNNTLVGRPYRVSPKGKGLFEIDKDGGIRVTADRGKKLILKLFKYGHLLSSKATTTPATDSTAEEVVPIRQPKRPPVKYPWRLLMIYRFDKSTEYTVYELDQLSMEDFKQLQISTMEKAKANGTFPLPPSAPPSRPTER